ncbi:putative pheromone precursor protein 1 protein [Phialemonium atrogriseum]|uniref:Pheromone protein 1 protein n=1 Tax=Phialemonium atrogriseum TaxID=1093897 RepID=A0AAJ0C5U5_9PEZI|nr:putative pheromone precursor protein 1 protein [Phialemonium atrogriseum]KAK1770012.1 putative pheromone precursor protein 1 protein [Phialemonium atrogriseum]
MKFSIPLAIFVVAASVEAAAIANPEPEPWCLIKGQSCWKPKRSAEAEPWCLIKGQSCWKVKRAAEAFAEALRPTEGTVHAREAEISNQPGNAAFMAKRQVDELALVLAAASEDPEGFYSALGLSDGFPADTATGAEKREPVDHEADKRWCLIKGQSCWKAKRAAEAVVSAIETVHDPRSTPFDPLARSKREAEPWCLIKGQSCWKRDASAEAACNAPNGACTKAKRDLHAIYNVARSILDEE